LLADLFAAHKLVLFDKSFDLVVGEGEPDFRCIKTFDGRVVKQLSFGGCSGFKMRVWALVCFTALLGDDPARAKYEALKVSTV
jgi:hypothetical protein